MIAELLAAFQHPSSSAFLVCGPLEYFPSLQSHKDLYLTACGFSYAASRWEKIIYKKLLNRLHNQTKHIGTVKASYIVGNVIVYITDDKASFARNKALILC